MQLRLPCLALALLAGSPDSQLPITPLAFGEPVDTDGDTLPDAVEDKLGTNPLVADVLVMLCGVVRLPDGSPASGASVWVRGGILPRFRSRANDGGVFHIEGWPEVLLPRTVYARELAPGFGSLFGETLVDGTVPGAPRARGSAPALPGRALGVIHLAPGLRSRLFDQPLLEATGHDVIVGDFDDDGFPDIVTDEGPNGGPDTLKVFLSGAGGELSVAQVISAGSIEQLSSGDIDRDGVVDLVGAGGTVSSLGSTSPTEVYRGLGDGSFERLDDVPAPLNDVVLADFDKDGHVDIAGTHQRFPHGLNVAYGNGDGSFQPGIDFGGTGSSAYVDLEAGDFDGDGYLDIAGAKASFPQNTVFLNDGTGGFSSGTSYSGVPTQSLEVGDIDRDGEVDVVYGGQAGVHFLPGVGDGIFGPTTPAKIVASPLFRYDNQIEISLMDWNCDGKTDVVKGGSVLFARDGFTFQGLRVVPNSLAFGTGSGDFNGDGLPDLVVSGPGVRLALNRSTTPDPVAGPLVPASRPLAMTVDDFNLDGRDDIAVLHEEGLEVFAGKGNGRFYLLFAVEYEQTVAFPREYVVVSGHIDADGILDLVTSDDPTTPGPGMRGVRVFRGLPGGGFSPGTPMKLGQVSRIELADVNADGLSDIIVFAAGRRITAVQSLPDGVLVPIDLVVDTTILDFDLADLDSDGNDDLVTVRTTGAGSGAVDVYRGNGDGTVTLLQSTPTTQPGKVRILDFDGAGGLDVVVHFVAPQGELGFFPGVGDGTLFPPTLFEAPLGFRGLHDVDLDGVTDFLFTEFVSTTFLSLATDLVVLFGDDPGTSHSFALAPASSAPLSLVFGDFDGDRAPDVAAISSAKIHLTYNQGRR